MPVFAEKRKWMHSKAKAMIHISTVMLYFL